MRDQRKLSIGLILALATFALFGSVSLVATINTIRWYVALPPEANLSILPFFVKVGLIRLPLQLIACFAGFFSIIFLTQQRARKVAIFAVVLLLLSHLAGWPFALQATRETTFLAKHGARLAFSVWLLIVLIALVPNNSFKPTPLRGAA